jgi:cob(I)alamin adenosyltransferase
MVKLNRIYTRTGDDGTTGLVDGSRISKAAPRMAAVGDVDEVNSALGLAVAELSQGPQADLLRLVQNDLFDLGADLATPIADVEPEWALRIVASQVERLEREIDAMNENLPALDSFILPGGSSAAGAIHLARAISRRAERSAVAAAQEVALNPHALAYLNRLSDLLFVMARHVNVGAGGDVKWVPGASR